MCGDIGVNKLRKQKLEQGACRVGAEQNESDASKLGDCTRGTLQCADCAVLQGKQQQDRPLLNQRVPKTGAESGCQNEHWPLTLLTEGRQRREEGQW